jgi:hypothetical protein
MSVRSFGNVCAALTLIVVLGGVSGAAAQTVTGTIQGTVVDTGGGVLPGVTVTIRQTDTGAERVVVTNEAGFFSAPYVPIGPYSATATLAGFGTVAREGIKVGLNDTRVVDFTLNPAVTEIVTVTGDAPPINQTNSEVKGSLTAEQIMDKPSLNAGNFLTLAETFTGFQENPTSGQNNPTASSGSSINFNNTGTRGATFQINGVNNDDSSENQNRQGAALSTIQEFQVLKNGYSAEFGRGDGAVVLVQTKSGTNQVNGDLYLYQQDGRLNARTFFAAPGSPKAVRQRTQYGFTAGLPIVQNKLFAFGNVDRTKLDGENPLTRDLFLPAELAQPRLTRGNDTPENRAWIQSIIDRYPSSLTPNDARSPRTWFGANEINWPDEDYSGRLDWNANQQNTIVGRYQWTHQLRETADVIIGDNAKQDNEQQNLGITWTRVFGGRPLDQRRRRRRERHADRPVHGHAGHGGDDRQRRQLPDPSGPDRPAVRLQPDVAMGEGALAEGRDRRPPPEARRPGGQLLARILDVHDVVRRRDLSDAVRGVPGRLRQQVPEGVRPVLPRESHERIERLCAG